LFNHFDGRAPTPDACGIAVFESIAVALALLAIPHYSAVSVSCC